MGKRRGKTKKLLLVALLGGAAAAVRHRLTSHDTPAPVSAGRSAPRTAAAPAVRDQGVKPLVSTPDGATSPPADAGAAAVDTGEVVSLPNPPRGPFAVAPEGPADDLKRISGVGPKLEKMLNQQGITTFAQLAGLTDGQVDELQELLSDFPGRIRRDRWVEQASRLLDAS